MAVFGDNFYSRFVVWAKIVLPLLALAILSSLFLFSKSHKPDSGVRLFSGNLSKFASKERITGPKFAGMTPSGIAIELSAKEGSPSITGGPGFNATGLKARIEMPDGARINVVAARGSIDSATMSAKLTGGIKLTTSSGYVARTKGLSFALNTVDIQSEGEITATGPLGVIRAGSLRLSLNSPNHTKAARNYVLVFKNGVKMIYNPNK